MHGSQESVVSLLKSLVDNDPSSDACEVAVCPTFLHLPLAEQLLQDSNIALGAQNVHQQEEGAFTGEVSAPMLAEYPVRYVIVGHSERRQLFKETDAVIAEKFTAVQQHGMTPILCLGETVEQRDSGQAEDIVLGQLDAVLGKVGVDSFNNAAIAYEPVWAIGTGRTATPEQAQEIHEVVRKHLRALDVNIAGKCRILYGGSVKSANAEELFSQPDIDGGLVGGASLDPAEFLKICTGAGSIRLCKL